MDGFEGPPGYSERFGLHYVNFGNPDRPRTSKQSAYFYSEIIKRNGFASTIGFPLPLKSNKFTTTTQQSNRPPSEVPSTSKVVWEKFS